jgi:hypothetical protein
MHVLKRLAVWFVEVALQAFLVGLLLILHFGHDEYSFTRGLLIYVDSTLVMFFLTGYLFTTAISRAVWRAKDFWSYSVVATVLFIFHFELLNVGIGGAFEPRDRIRIIVVGASAALLTTLVGTSVLRRWKAVVSHSERVADPSTPPTRSG